MTKLTPRQADTLVALISLCPTPGSHTSAFQIAGEMYGEKGTRPWGMGIRSTVRKMLSVLVRAGLVQRNMARYIDGISNYADHDTYEPTEAGREYHA